MPHDSNKTVLDNGIRIVTKQVPQARSVTMGVWVNVGARDEKAEEGGLCHLLEHMIFKGTRNRSSLQIAKELDAVGGLSNAFTGKENTCFHARVLGKHFTILADIFSVMHSLHKLLQIKGITLSQFRQKPNKQRFFGIGAR